MSETPRQEQARPYWAWCGSWRAILLLVLGALGARLVYLILLCPYTLVEDEAHYWEWSRHLDWSYYSKGPGIAWTIALSTGLFGTSEASVRAPAAVLSALLMLGVAGIAADVARDLRCGFVAGMLTLLAPIFLVTGLVMTVDVGYVAMWALAAWGAWRSLGRGNAWGWAAFGLAMAIGFLFKYTVLLLLPGIALYALLDPGARHVARRQWAWILAGLAITCLGLVPVLIWNEANDWVTVHHLLGHLGVVGGDMPSSGNAEAYTPMWTLEFLGTQAFMLGLPGLLCVFSIIEAVRRRREDAARWSGQLFLICCALPILVFYLSVTLFTDGEGNWAMAGYSTLLSLAGWGVIDGMDEWTRRHRRWLAIETRPRPREGLIRRRPEMPRQIVWHWSIVIGVVTVLLTARVDLLLDLVHLERLIPKGRIMGADELADEIFELSERARHDPRNVDGLEPMIIAQHYGRASELAFYLRDRVPVVYCSSSKMAGRQTQYDFWKSTDLSDLDHLAGRPGVLLGGERSQWEGVFDVVTDPVEVVNETKRGRQTYLGFGYRGFEDSP